jgi:hypothetical protein
MSRLMVVTGVTGIQVCSNHSMKDCFTQQRQGNSVASTFLATPGWKVRGITRNPSSGAAKELAIRGVDIVKADLDDKSSLVQAFDGAHVIFANTDFFNPLFTALEKPGITGGRSALLYAHNVEVAQGLNVLEAASSASVLKTLDRLIYSSLPDMTKLSKGKYRELFHYNCKAEVERAVHRFPELEKRFSSLHVGHYVTNWHIFPPARPKKQSDGSFIIERPFSNDLVTPFIYTHKDTGPFVKALVDLPAGTNLLATSENLTWPEFTKVWGDVLGVKAIYKEVSFEEHLDGVPGGLNEELLDSFKCANEFGFGLENDLGIVTAEQVGYERPVSFLIKLMCCSWGSRCPLPPWQSMSSLRIGRLCCSIP